MTLDGPPSGTDIPHFTLGRPEYDVVTGQRDSAVRTLVTEEGERFRVATVSAGSGQALVLAQPLATNDRTLEKLGGVLFAFGALGAWLAFRTGSGETIQALFPVLFVFLFISSMNTPRDLIDVEWFQTAATLNPVSYMIELVRSLIIEGWNLQALALGFGFTIVIGVASIALASRALRTRMTRT